MSAFYNSLANTSLRLIREKGKACVIRYTGSKTYDVDNDVVSSAANSDVATKYVRTEFKQSEVDGTIVQENDFKALVAGSSLTTRPKTNDFLIDEGVKYKIKDVKIIKPADIVLLYTLYLTDVGAVT